MNRQCLRLRTKTFGAFFFTVLAVLCLAPAGHADSVPDWFRRLAKTPLPAYPAETTAVVLLDETTVTVKNANDITETHRWVAKILRPEGRDLGEVVLQFDGDSRISSLKGWSIAANGQEYSVKEFDMLEASGFGTFELYTDIRYKAMKLPAAEPGAFLAFECVQKRHPQVLEMRLGIQGANPVRTSRFTLALPQGWKYDYRFANIPEKAPQSMGANQWTWEFGDLPGYEKERFMPSPAAIDGQMVVHFLPPDQPELRTSSWREIGAWDNRLNLSRQEATPEIRAKVMQLIQGKPDPADKIRALAEYVQKEVRYVAIEIGIGGFQAHMAEDVFTHRYGDCKDKATLLVTMLKAIGIDAYLVGVDGDRGVIIPDLPSIEYDHVITAIKLPDGVRPDAFHSIVDVPRVGTLLIFDPTSETVPVGWLPPRLQASYGVASLPDGGELIKLPLLPPSLNRLLRVGNLELLSDGTLKGDVRELRTGSIAAAMRGRLLMQNGQDRTKLVEGMLAGSLARYEVLHPAFMDLENTEKPLGTNYSFLAPGYARSLGSSFLVRSRVLGVKAWSIAEGKPRKFAVEFEEGATSESDVFDIKLPFGVTLDELPRATNAVYDFAEYHSQISLKDGVLHYERTYIIKDVAVPVEKMDQLKSLMRAIGNDERNTAVFKRATAQ